MKRLLLVVTLISIATIATAQQELRVQHIKTTVNTEGNESAPTMLNSQTLLYSQMPHSLSSGRKLELDDALMQILQAPILSDSMPAHPQVIKELNSSNQHTGNTAFDARNNILYFARCAPDDEGRIPCGLYSAHLKKGKWRNIKPLDKEINLEGYTSTQPAVAYTTDGSTLLYYSSNRPGGEGGMDIWYTIITKDKTSTPVNLGPTINSGYDEITPFYDQNHQSLYFSSDRLGGMGGFDIYASLGSRNSYTHPILMPTPINTKHNDMYYMVADSNATYGYLSSNRQGALFATDSFCCNDLFRWSLEDVSEPEPAPVVADEPPMEAPPELQWLMTTPTPRNPIVLFFHNDEPNPGSVEKTTRVSYDQTIDAYMALRPQYKRAWEKTLKGAALDSVHRVLDNFFDNEVKGNYDRLDKFMWLMAQQLWDGHNVTITIKGYASPLFNSDYNALLSQRRISCFLNYLRQWNSGNLRRCIADGSLRVIQAPYGSSTAASNVSNNSKDLSHSVYSVEAARERRVEIIDFSTSD